MSHLTGRKIWLARKSWYAQKKKLAQQELAEKNPLQLEPTDELKGESA